MLTALAVVALLAFEKRSGRSGQGGANVGRGVAKLAASCGFVWAALACGALESAYGRFVLAGLVACWWGDALLIPPGQGRAFLLGIAAFLSGHVAYAIAFVGLGLSLPATAAAVVAIGLCVWRLWLWLGPHVGGDMRVPVQAYFVVISGMAIASVGAAGAGASAWGAVGAIGFAASDVSVARDRFVAPGFANGAWGLPLYFASQLVLAASIPLMSVSGG